VSGRRHAAVAGCAALLAASGARAASAQLPGRWDFRARMITRPELQSVLARYQAAAASPAYSAGLRHRAAAIADSIRARLADGDLRAGDRLRLVVEGQPSLSDSFAVSGGPALVLPVVGSVDLKGVLRSELAGRLTARVDSVYRNVAVRVIVLTRLGVTGGVKNPGFYSLTGDAVVADAITSAGGVAPTAVLNQMYIERGRDRLWSGDSLQVAMQEGRTIAALRLLDGDRIVVPVQIPTSTTATLQMMSYIGSLLLSFIAVGRII
jgi:protein involved in polysaccharide export with SLBB domain